MISIIAAVANNYCIGQNNQLPWHIPEDLKHFKKLTSGKTVLMGRKTFESIIGYLGKPLPKRKNIVITGNEYYEVPNEVIVYTDLDKALRDNSDEDIFIIGGAGIYKQTIDKADKLYITWIKKEIDGDAYFPKIYPDKWNETFKEEYDDFIFTEYDKIK